MTLQKLAIYYGFPSLVNDSRGDVEAAAKIFSQFSHVVLGANLQNDGHGAKPKHADHDNTRGIIQKASDSEFYGYINLGVLNTPEPHSLDEIKQGILNWKTMGVAGIFFDAAGFEYGVTRERQNESIRCAHEASLKAFVNSHQPEDTFGHQKVPLSSNGGGNVHGIKSAVGERDLYLFESFVISGGIYQDPAFTRDKLNKLNRFKEEFKIRTFGVASFDKIDEATEPHLKHLFYGAVLANMDGICLADPTYAATSNRLHLFTPSFHREV